MGILEIVAAFTKYQGYDGLISQEDLDQGDTAQRCGHYLSYMKLLDQPVEAYYDHVMKCLQLSPGVYRRSSNLEYWGSDPTNFSRDQRSALETAMVIFKDENRLEESKNYLNKRFGFHQNRDIVSPGEMRLFNEGISRYFWDLFLLGDLMLRKSDNYDVDNMLALQMLVCYLIKPTFISRIAMKLYLRTNFMDRVYSYHRIDGLNNGCEPMAYLTDFAYMKLVPGYKPKSSFE